MPANFVSTRSTRSVIRGLCPPVIRALKRELSAPCNWSGNYADWKSASARCAGYDQSTILESVRKSAALVRDGVAAFERDSVAFQQPEYSWALLSSLLHAAAVEESLGVLDFGGSLGSTYFQHRRWLDDVRHVRWCVVEQPHFVECGRDEFSNERLCFYESIPECTAGESINVALFSSVLGYLPDPGNYLRQVVAIPTIKFILVDRTGFAIDDRARITVQTVSSRIYPASYPCRFLSVSELKETLEPEFEMMADFDALDEGPSFAEFKGMLFRRRSPGSACI